MRNWSKEGRIPLIILSIRIFRKYCWIGVIWTRLFLSAVFGQKLSCVPWNIVCPYSVSSFWSQITIMWCFYRVKGSESFLTFPEILLMHWELGDFFLTSAHFCGVGLYMGDKGKNLRKASKVTAFDVLGRWALHFVCLYLANPATGWLYDPVACLRAPICSDSVVVPR